uniref:HTH_Tnp_Tc3_1 domain-containing protein n=2 Tax=Caenorhabditis japonica TaxID=281687 RepID=A0A8R1EBB7_CAEJA
MTQLGFSTLQMSRRITRSRCCVRNYARDTMAHGSAKPTRLPRIVNDRDERSVRMSGHFLPEQFQTVGELKDAVTKEWDKLQSSYLESLTQSMSNRLCQVMQKFVGPTPY